MKCDLCSADQPPGTRAWTYLTPSEVRTEVEALVSGKFWAEDQYWLVCQECHKLIVQDKPMALLDHCLDGLVREAEAAGTTLSEKGMKEAIRVVGLFWLRRAPEPCEEIL